MSFEIIKERRIAMGLSQKQLAEMLGISQQHLDRYEKGYQIPVEKIPHVAKVLKIDMWKLLPKEFEKPEEILSEDEKAMLELFRKSKGNNSNNTTASKAG